MDNFRPSRAWLLVAAILLASRGEAAIDGEVAIDGRTLFVLHEPEAETTAAERARFAMASIAAALGDPQCGPEKIEVSESVAGPVVQLCSRPVLVVTEADARHEASTAAALAAAWSEKLRVEFANHKQALYSRRLLRTAVVGLLLPLGYLVGLVLLRLLFRRIAAWGETAGRVAPTADDRVTLLSGPVTRRALAQIASVVKWAVYGVLTYSFAVAFLRQFPGSARWAAVLLEPLEQGAPHLAPQAFAVLLRLFAAVLILIATRAVLGILGRVFEQIRKGQLRIGPFLSPETAGPAELIGRVLTVVVAALLLVLLVPGESGVAALGLLGLLGLAVALGARDAAANLIGGLVMLYGRPFRTGQRIRAGHVTGTVIRKTLLHTRVEAPDAREVLLPNAWIFRRPLEVVGPPRSVRLRVTLSAPEGTDLGSGLFRHAAVEAGCRREEGRVHLARVHEERIVFDVEWPLARGADAAGVRSEFVRCLLLRAPGMQVRILDVDDLGG